MYRNYVRISRSRRQYRQTKEAAPLCNWAHTFVVCGSSEQVVRKFYELTVPSIISWLGSASGKGKSRRYIHTLLHICHKRKQGWPACRDSDVTHTVDRSVTSMLLRVRARARATYDRKKRGTTGTS